MSDIHKKQDDFPVPSWLPWLITIALGVSVIAALGTFGAMLDRAFGKRSVCTFDRNEPRKGEPGDGLDGKPVDGWWWDIYKCSDGTERRVLVAGPRG